MNIEVPLSHRILDYVAKHKALILALGLVGFGALAVGRWIATSGTVQQGLWFSFGTGVLSALVIAFVSDFMSKEFFYDVLRNFQTSVHEGGLVHASHRDIPSRVEAITRFFAVGQTAKIATFTADNYINDEQVLELLRSRVKDGSKIQVLLHTPIYSLRSYVDKLRGFAKHGKRHLTALELVRQQSLTFSKIEALKSEFGESFQVRFTSVQLHVHTAIWGNRRIYSSLILRGVDGQDSPCIEVFPGLKDARLFERFEKDFDYVWQRPDLIFSVEDIKPLYARLLSKYPMDVELTDLDESFISEIEAEAAKMKAKKHPPTASH